jgi:hypothetical protein
LQDSVANTVALLWPLRRREYGLGLDHLAGETDHMAYMRRYPSSPAGKLEGLLVVAAVAVGWRRLLRNPARRPCRHGGVAERLRDVLRFGPGDAR